MPTQQIYFGHRLPTISNSTAALVNQHTLLVTLTVAGIADWILAHLAISLIMISTPSYLRDYSTSGHVHF